MLRHWHAQRRRISRQADRRYIGVAGQGHQSISAIISWNAGNPDWLSLVILGGRLAPAAALPNSTAPPLANVIALPAQALLQSDVQTLVTNHAGESHYAQVVTPEQLAAVHFEEPVLQEHPMTGHRVRVLLPESDDEHTILLGQCFSLDGSGSEAAQRILISSDPTPGTDEVIWPLCPPHASVTFMHAELLRVYGAVPPSLAFHGEVPAAEVQVPPAAAQFAAEAPAAAGAAAPVAAAGAVLAQAYAQQFQQGQQQQQQQPQPQPQQQPQPQPQQQPQPQPQQALVHWAGQPPLHPGPAPFVPPAQPPIPPPMPLLPPVLPPAQPNPAPGILPNVAAPVPPAGPLPPHLGAPLPPAVGAPMLVAGGAPAPVAANMASHPLAASLLCRLSAQDLVMIGNFDDLVRILAPASGAPAYAFLPGHDVNSRVEYVDERLSDLTASAPLPPINSAGWAGVFATARALVRSTRVSSSAGSSGSLSSSFGRAADRHLLAQQAVTGAAASSSAASALDPQEATAIRSAAAAIDQEGTLARSMQPMGSAVSNLMPTPPTDLQSVQNLGARMAALPASVQIIEAAGQGRFAATSSTHMQALSLTLSTATAAFYERASRELRLFVARETELISDARKLALRNLIADVFRGKPQLVTETKLSSTGGDSLFASLRSGDVNHAMTVMSWMDMVVRLIESQSVISAVIRRATAIRSSVLRVRGLAR